MDVTQNKSNMFSRRFGQVLQVAQDETVEPLAMIAILPEPFLPWTCLAPAGAISGKPALKKLGLYQMTSLEKIWLHT